MAVNQHLVVIGQLARQRATNILSYKSYTRRGLIDNSISNWLDF